jgi:predicted transcriptional regulator
MQVSTQMGPFSIVPEWVLDRGLSSTALKLYIVLARFADWDTGIAFPARDTLAERMDCSEKTVDRAVKELVEAQCIEKEFRGRYQSARYRVLQVDPRGTKMSIVETKVSDEGTKMSSRSDKNVHITITTEQEPLKQEPLNDISTKFDQFWKLYPRKVGKGKARQAFEKALEKTNIDTILAGVEAYVYHEGYNDMEFIAHPTSWLNGERWDDEYKTPLRKETPGPGKREWVRVQHELGEHWACEPGEFGCK